MMFKHLLTSTLVCSLDVLRELARDCGLDVAGAEEGQPFLMPGGLLIDIVSAEAAESADLVACARWSDVQKGVPGTLPGTIKGACARCGTPIGWRPYIPKRPEKVCIDCVERDAERRLAGTSRSTSGGLH